MPASVTSGAPATPSCPTSRDLACESGDSHDHSLRISRTTRTPATLAVLVSADRCLPRRRSLVQSSFLFPVVSHCDLGGDSSNAQYGGVIEALTRRTRPHSNSLYSDGDNNVDESRIPFGDNFRGSFKRGCQYRGRQQRLFGLLCRQKRPLSHISWHFGILAFEESQTANSSTHLHHGQSCLPKLQRLCSGACKGRTRTSDQDLEELKEVSTTSTTTTTTTTTTFFST